MSINSNNNKNPIMVIGATNHINKLDSALIRPGRFDRILKVDMPSLDDLKTIITNIKIWFNWMKRIIKT